MFSGIISQAGLSGYRPTILKANGFKALLPCVLEIPDSNAGRLEGT